MCEWAWMLMLAECVHNNLSCPEVLCFRTTLPTELSSMSSENSMDTFHSGWRKWAEQNERLLCFSRQLERQLAKWQFSPFWTKHRQVCCMTGHQMSSTCIQDHRKQQNLELSLFDGQETPTPAELSLSPVPCKHWHRQSWIKQHMGRQQSIPFTARQVLNCKWTWKRKLKPCGLSRGPAARKMIAPFDVHNMQKQTVPYENSLTL